MTQRAPSSVARRIAGALWPDVQFQRRVARGVYGFSCAGHGGLVAIVGEAPFTEEQVERFREAGRTELVVYRPGRSFTSIQYTQASLREWAETYGAELYEAIVGEEDCDWALLCYENDDIRTGAIAAGYLSEGVTPETVRSSVETWSPRWLGITPTPAEFGEGEAVMQAAWGDWHERVPEGSVGVAITRADGSESYGIIPRAAYEGAEQRGSHFETHRKIIDITDLEEVERL